MKRRVGPFEVCPIGLGCMSLSHAYGTPPPREAAEALLRKAVDIGYDFFDTAALYGWGANENLVGDVLGNGHRGLVIASKCGLSRVDGKRVIDGRPETLLVAIDESLHRLRAETIDLYYLHRWDKSVAIEDSVGALARMVEAGKVRAIGLSEISAQTLRKAHAVHPIAAVQSEYSPWSRNVELGVLAASAELGAAFVAFSPLARGLLAGAIAPDTRFVEGDIRRGMPRFQGDNLRRNLELFRRFAGIALEVGCTPAQLVLAWVLSRGDHVLAIPGTVSEAHLAENLDATQLRVGAATLLEITALFEPSSVAGPRYSAATQAEIDTEDFETVA
jgi:aryl-alcohol dehydrogenase-like predicted oxidoreductase